MSIDIFGNPVINFKKVKSGTEEDYLHPVESQIFTNDEKFIDEMPERRPILILILFLILAAVILFTQLIRIQIFSFSYYQSLSSGNSVRVVLVPATRGLILDSKLKPLARNVYKNALVVEIAELPRNKTKRQKLYAKMKNVVNLTDDEIKQIEDVHLAGSSELILRNNINHNQMLIWKEKLSNTPAFTIAQKLIRSYEIDHGLSHLLGYMGRVNEKEVEENNFLPTEDIGRSGLESVYDKELRGQMESVTVEVDARGNIVRKLTSPNNRSAISGDNLKLYLNLDLQKVAAKFLQEAMDARDKKYGKDEKLGASIVVMNAKNGGILALVSLPDYNNNLFAAGISSKDYQDLQNNPTLPMLNRAIQAQLPSGSVIKPTIAAGALDAGIISANFTIDTPPSLEIGNFKFSDWKDHGLTDIRRAIAESNNIFFYGLGGGWPGHMNGLGIEKLDEYLKRFGFGSKTGIDLTGERSGFVPTPEWKLKIKDEQWYIGDTYHLSIGQGDFLTTPIQMAAATMVVANGGTLYKPKLVEALLDSKNKELQKVSPESKNKEFISSDALSVVREGMRQTVEIGSAKILNNLKVPIAAKTGTAQYGTEKRTHGWFTCFAPYNDPEIVVAAVVEGGGSGNESAMLVTEKILRYYYKDPK